MNSRPLNILDMPDEILIKIILYLTPTQRVALGRSCKRTDTLVFEEKELLRNLDFSEDAFLTTASDVYRYFQNENGSKHIIKLNLKNVTCLKLSYNPLSFIDYIKRATELVDLNIQGLMIRDFSQLVSLLTPLRCLMKLSIDWPPFVSKDNDDSYPEVLRERFSRLTYLSVRIGSIGYAKQFHRALRSCRELKELVITVTVIFVPDHRPTRGIKLKNLDIVKYHGPDVREAEEYYLSIIPHPEQLTHFQLTDDASEISGFYLERNVAVCDELLESKSMKTASYNYPRFASRLGGFVISSCLLEEVIRINHETAPERFCCLSPFKDEDEEGRLVLPSVLKSSSCMLKIEEAKRLLKDPKYPISCLNIKHNIGVDCDTNIVASAFPSLTELVLSNVTEKKRDTSKKTKLYSHGSSVRSHSAATKELDEILNLDSCFSKLVENTPHVRNLMINANLRDIDEDETWDLAALRLISCWKSLRTLRLRHIPIVDGKFLIEIGKHCKQLENLELHNLGGTGAVFCYENELRQMFIDCSKLRHFVLLDDNVGELSKMLCCIADNNRQLRTVHIGRYRNLVYVNHLRSTIEQLLQHCSELTELVCYIDVISEGSSDDMTRTFERLAHELNRPNFELKLYSRLEERQTNIRKDFPALFCL